jgi:two-component system, cell cycle sensor histidine kinase and response regulator CckA
MQQLRKTDLLQHLRCRRDTIADIWYQAIVRTSFTPRSSTVVRQNLVELTDQAITVLLTEPFRRTQAEAIGATLARLRYLQSEALGRTLSVLADQLVAELPADARIALQPTLSRLLGTIAAGFVHQARETILAEQEQLHEALRIERARIADALRDSEALYRSIVENTSELVSVLDQEGRYIYASPSFQRVLGNYPADIIDTTLFEHIHPDDRALVLERWQQLFTWGSMQATFRYSRADGAWRWLETSATHNLHGDEAAVVMVGRDSTDQRELEAHLLMMQKQESVGRLASGAAHEFNNLLTGISAYAELAMKLLPADHEVRHDLEQIQQISEHAAHLAHQMLTFTRTQPTVPRTIDLNRHLREMVRLLRRLIGEDIELVTILTPEPTLVNLDPGQFEQLIINMALNARDAMPEGGRLLVETSHRVIDAEYARQHIDMHPGPYVLLTISDTGMGMPSDVQARIFERFYTTKAPDQGTGLGLAVSYDIVKQHNGTIWVYSEPQHGTTFNIHLPHLTHDTDTALSPPAMTEEPPKGTETVLLVEDEPTVLRLTAQMLHSLGYTVLEASHGDDALGIAERYPRDAIQLLLTDLVMPRQGGQRLAERLLQVQPGMKVLFMSGYTEQVVLQHGQFAHAVAFVQKPFTYATLAHKVREVLDAS